MKLHNFKEIEENCIKLLNLYIKLVLTDFYKLPQCLDKILPMFLIIAIYFTKPRKLRSERGGVLHASVINLG